MIIRDTKVADDALSKIQLGWLDHEFTAYGTAYYADGAMQYRVSNVPEKIYSFLDEAGIQDIYPANLVRYTERCPLPEGLKEEKNLEVKKTLARSLRDRYPKELFLLLQETADALRNDNACGLLERQREQLEGYFDNVRLDCLAELVRYSYKSLKLTRSSYQAFMKWIDREYKNLEDDFVPKKTSEGHIYAMQYLHEGEACYLADALCAHIYAQKFQLEQNGQITTPLYRHTFWYDYQTSFRQAKAAQEKLVQKILTDHYWSQVRQIRAMGAKLSHASSILDQVKREMGADASVTFVRYLRQWDVF